jgi:hypothetical protein
MAFLPGYDAIIIIGGTDLSAYTEKVTASVKRADQKLPRLGANQVARLVGPPETELKINGWFDPVVAALLFPLSVAAIATKVPVSYQPQGGAGPTRTGTAYVLDYDDETDAKNPGMWTATLVVDGDWA